GRAPNTRELRREALFPAMMPPPLITESVIPAARSATEARTTPDPEPAPDSVPPPISAPMFTPRPAAPPIESPPNDAFSAFSGETGTLASRDRPGAHTLGEAAREPSAPVPDHVTDVEGIGEEYELVEGVVEVEPDAEDDAVRPSMLPREAGFDDAQEITDVFETRTRFMSTPSVRPEQLGELEILGEADAEEQLATATPEVEEAPISSRRARSLGSEPPESGPQVASLAPPAPIAPHSMEVVLPMAQSPGEYRPDVHASSRTMRAPAVVPTPAESHTAEIVRPLLDLDAQVAEAIGHVPLFQPATFGELLDATLDL
ncbi:MAG: hypothetical protein JWM74_2818, partial [Myxococcaceae bacterium]|nr:hypothetical protein [Myxococcaceae bacterium]